MTTKQLSIGSISHGTMRSEDLFPTLLDALESVDKERAAKFADSLEFDIDDIDTEGESGSDDAEALDEAVNELFDILNEYCPDYTYFGAHQGDGSDYGVWPSWDSLDEAEHDGELLKVADTSDVPDDYIGNVLHVNDHRNATLYMVHEGEFVELWTIV